jgi:uncharacterized membrane protein YfhO
LIFGASSALAGGLSAIVVLPALFSLRGGKADLTLSGLGFRTNFNLFESFARLFWGSNDGIYPSAGFPNIYCGLIVVVFAILFFIAKGIKLSEKIGAGFLLAIIFISFYINTFNLVWHGLNETVGFPYRYSFVFTFLLIDIAYKGYAWAKEDLPAKENGKKLIWIFLPLFIYALFIEKHQYSDLGTGKIYVNMIFLVFILLTFYLYALKKTCLWGLILAGICFIELGSHGYIALNERSYDNHHDFKKFVRANQPVVNQIKENDSSFFRMEKAYRYSHNDAMTLNYRGLTHFSSSGKDFVKDFMRKMGFEADSLKIVYDDDALLTVDSLLGVKYLLSEDQIEKPYELLWQQADILVYLNPYALPLGFMVSRNVLDVFLDEGDFLELQTNIWESMIGDAGDDLFVLMENGEIDIDMDVFAGYYDELAASPFRINSFSDSYFEGEITNSGDKQFALFTIPYDDGWKVSVDGKRMPAVKVFDTFISVEIPAGTHDISLRYVPQGFYLGLIITVLSLGGLLVWLIVTVRSPLRQGDCHCERSEAIQKVHK